MNSCAILEALTTDLNCTCYHLYSYLACCPCNCSQIAHELIWLPIL